MMNSRFASLLAAVLFLSLCLGAVPVRGQDDAEGADPLSGGGLLRLAVGNGLTALVVSDARSNEVAIRLELGGGAAADPAGKEGLSAIALLALLGEKSGAYPGGEIEAGPAATTLRFRTAGSAFGPALGALAARLGSASSGVSLEAFDAARRLATERAKSAAGAADRALGAALFGAGHPAARAWAGEPESIAALRIEDVRATLSPAVPASLAALAVVGKLAGVEGLAEIPIRLAAWPAAKSSAAAPLPKIPRQGRRAVLVPAGGADLEVRVAFLLPPRGDARLPRAAAVAANAIRPPAGVAPGSFSIRFHGRRMDATVLVVSWRTQKPEDAAAGIAAIEASLAVARGAATKEDAPVPSVDSLSPDLRAAIALLESNPDENALTRPAVSASGPAIDLDAIVAVIAGPSAGTAETALRANGFAAEKR